MKKVLFYTLIYLSIGYANSAVVNIDAINSGWYTSVGSQNGTNSNINARPSRRNWLGFDLSTISDTITFAKLEVVSDAANGSGQFFIWNDVLTNYSSLGHQNDALIYEDLGSGVTYASGSHTAGTINSFVFNSNGIDALNSATSFWAIGGSHNAVGNAFGFTSGVGSGDHIRLVVETTVSLIPLPATIWFFVSALIGLYGMNFKSKNN